MRQKEVFRLDQTLFRLFDYQRFADNAALRAVIDEVEDRYAAVALDDDALATLSAAGDPHLRAKERGEMDERP